MRGDFAWALEELRGGERLQRSGTTSGVEWKGQFVTLQPGYPNGIAINVNTAEAVGEKEGTVCKFRPYFMLRKIDGSFVPWTASADDLLAEDWQRWSPERWLNPDPDPTTAEVARGSAAVVSTAEAAGDTEDDEELDEDEDDGVLDPAGADSAAGDGPAPESD